MSVGLSIIIIILFVALTAVISKLACMYGYEKGKNDELNRMLRDICTPVDESTV